MGDGFRVLVRDGGVLVGPGGVPLSFFMLSGIVVLGCGVVGLGGLFVMMGEGAVGSVCRGDRL